VIHAEPEVGEVDREVEAEEVHVAEDAEEGFKLLDQRQEEELVPLCERGTWLASLMISCARIGKHPPQKRTSDLSAQLWRFTERMHHCGRISSTSSITGV
jgi:hypothetical protein